jgi:hypothetical protein
VQTADAKDNMKLFRPRNYPILRGSALLLDDDRGVPLDGRACAAARHPSRPGNPEPAADPAAAPSTPFFAT